MLPLSGLFAATNTTIREGRAALPDFVFGVLADGGVSCGSEEGGKLGSCRAGKIGRQTILGNHAAECFQPPRYSRWDNAFVSQDAATMVAWIYQVFGEHDECLVTRLGMRHEMAISLPNIFQATWLAKKFLFTG